MIEQKLKKIIRDIPDFPKPGIIFKDITPILMNPDICDEIADEFIEQIRQPIDVVCAVESRGFFFGPLIAQKLAVPFVPIRKEGKLPGDTYSNSYDLEYGSATIEMQQGALKEGQNVLIHDDLIATGGTVLAAIELIERQKAIVSSAAFLVSLEFLDGIQSLREKIDNTITLVEYD